MASYKEWRAQRHKALAELDVTWMKGSPDIALIALHKSRYECDEMTREHRNESREWLEKRGFGRIGGLPWPPRGHMP